MDHHSQRVQQWRNYFLQNHHIAFIRNDPDGPPMVGECESETKPPLAPLPGMFGDESDTSVSSDEVAPTSHLYSRKSAVEMLMADQRRVYQQVHSKELAKLENKWQAEVSSHLSRIEGLIYNISQLERTVDR